jgi:nucleotide-binding universal stress UspA family protein
VKQIQKILFPIDFTESVEPLLPWLSTFADKFGAAVYVLFVTQDFSGFDSFYVPHGNIQSFQEEALAGARKKMAAVAQEYLKGFARLETRVMSGAPAEKIVELARQEKIDLIIMGAHGRAGLERAIFGSVADKVVRSAPCPVLTIRP